MIYTCTLNPSLDYYLEFDKPLEKGVRNRSQLEYYEAGGKGMNVSIVLNNLLIPTRAYGFLGGFTKDFYIKLLEKYEYIEPNFTTIEGNTRINIKLHDTTGELDCNAAGPYITYSDFDKFRQKVKRLDEKDYFVYAGSTPEYLGSQIVDLLKSCMEEGVRVVLDTTPSIILDCLSSKPFLVKTTPSELSQLLQKELLTKQDYVVAMKEVIKLGAKYVLLLSDDQTAYLASEDGIYESPVLNQSPAVNTVGTGDSLVAGFLMNYLRSSDGLDSFKFAVCCGSATAYSKGLATREKINSFYEKVDVTKL